MLWARSKIAALTDARHNGADANDIRIAITEVALAHHLVSAHTSLVAVDLMPTAPPGVTPVSMKIALDLPEGMGREDVIGTLPRTATPASLHALLGVLALLLAGLLWRMRERLTPCMRP